MDRPFPPTFRILADINLTGNGYRIREISGCPAFGSLHLSAGSRHNSLLCGVFSSDCYTVRFLHLFREALPRPTAKAPRGEGRGTRALFRLLAFRPLLRAPPRVAVSFLGASAKTIPLEPRGKGEVFTLGPSDTRLLSGRLRLRPHIPPVAASCARKRGTLDRDCAPGAQHACAFSGNGSSVWIKVWIIDSLAIVLCVA